MIDHVGNAVILARAQLQAIDPSALETKVQTGTYRLLLETLITLGTRSHQQKSADGAAHVVMSKISAVGEVVDHLHTTWSAETKAAEVQIAASRA